MAIPYSTILWSIGVPFCGPFLSHLVVRCYSHKLASGSPPGGDDGHKYGRSYVRLIIYCDGFGHVNCRKHRSISVNHMKSFGKYEPLGFLAAWYKNGGDHLTAQSHIAGIPTLPQVKAWMDANPDLVFLLCGNIMSMDDHMGEYYFVCCFCS